jgi:hypothetical protein
MGTDNLQNIWKNIDSEIKHKTINELNQSLAAATRKTINKFLILLIIDIVVCAGLIIFLIVTALNRQGDLLYQLNNALLCLITLSSLIVSILSLNRLHNNKLNLPLKDWAEQRIRLLSRWLLGKYSKLYVVILPVLLAMINISIHVYYEYKPFIDVMRNRESIIGLSVGFIVGLFVSFYAVNKIRRYQIKNLGYLKELHAQLSKDSI